jgi:hypothetical protein
MIQIQPVHRNDKGAAVVALHAGLLFLIHNEADISDNDRRTLEKGLAPDLRDQVYGDWTAHFVSFWQERLAKRFRLLVNGDVDKTTASALNTRLVELGAPANDSPAIQVTPFVNSYEFKGASRFRKVIPVAAPFNKPTNWLAIGGVGNAGLVASIGTDGEVLWSRTYSLAGHALSFHDGVFGWRDGLGFVLLSSVAMPTAGRSAYAVVCTDMDGKVRWARLIRTDRTRLASHIRALQEGKEYLLFGWANDAPGSTRDAVELVRLKADGTVLRSAHLQLGSDDEIFDAVAVGDGYYLIGNSVRSPGLAGFVVYINMQLDVYGAWLLTGTDKGLMLSPRTAIGTFDRLLLAGRSSPDNLRQSSMIAHIYPGSNLTTPELVRAVSFSFTDGQDLPTQIAALGPDILVLNQPEGFVRPQTIVRFDGTLAPQAHYGFDFTGGAELQSLEIGGNDTVLIGGADKSHPPNDQALLLATGANLECCKTKILPPLTLQALPLTLQPVKATVTDVPVTQEPAAIVMADVAAKAVSLCKETDDPPPVKITPFVNAYEFKGAARFRKTIPVTGVVASDGKAQAAAAACLAIGSEADAGLVAMIGLSGEVLWSRNYSLSGSTVIFVDGVVADGGYVLLAVLPLLGPAQPSGGPPIPGSPIPGSPIAGRQVYGVVRIDQSGNLKWARQIRTDRTRFASRVVRQPGPPEEFLLTGWANETPDSTQDAMELIRLKADGTVLRSVHLKMGSDDEIQSVIPFGSGYLLIGDSIRPPGLAAVLIYTDAALNIAGSWLLTGTGQGLMLAPTAVLALSNRLVLAGRSSPDNLVQSSMIAEAVLTSPQGRALLTVTRASSFSFTDGQDQPTRVAAIGSDILVFNQSIALARPQTVLRFNADLAALAHYGFDFPDGAQLYSLEVSGNDTVLIAGADTSHSPHEQALLIATGASLECCKTKPLPAPKLTPLPITQQNVQVTVTERVATNVSAAVRVTDTTATVHRLCGQAIETQGEQLVQSPYLTLQSAGSTGTDATRGILLRWHLMGVLESHLPKGGLAHTTVNFNKPDDFVAIYRAPWPGSAVPARQLSFATDKPTYVDSTNGLLVFETGTGTPRDLFHVRFLNAAAYAAALAASNPAQNMVGFLTAYGANPIEIELRNRLAVACDLNLTSPAYTARVETLSVGENRPLSPKIVTSRRILGAADGPTPRLIAENMRSIRVECTGAQLSGVAFRCYDDVLTYVNQAKQWIPIDRFALTLDQATTFLRLEDPARTPVDGRWWKFNDGAFVNVKNYHDRWQKPGDGIQAAVQQYVTLSEHDPQARADLTGTGSEDGSIKTSYLDLLRVASLDYHVACMLGLGHKDSGVDERTSYIHVAEYITRGDLADGAGPRPVQHLYMSLPTTLAQSRLPLVPDLYAAEYGLSVPTANGTPYSLTDAKGYTPDGLARYIRLYPDCRLLYAQDLSFFNPVDLFDLAEKSLPVLYGVEYRKAGEQAWRKPEIAHDDVYADTATPAIAEPMPSPFPAKSRETAFIHKETEPGIHEYAVYGINLFFRASVLSPTRATDDTRFHKPNRLLPPSDLKVQLIQEENPLILTTQKEQDQLTPLQLAPDPTLVRLTCNYAHVQDATYGFADSIEIFFRRAPPGNVIGGVKSVTANSNMPTIRIETEPYTYLSTLGTDPNTRETVQPAIPPAGKANFVGGVLVAGDKRYIITDITWPDPNSGNNPIFLVSKTTTTGVKETGGSRALVIDDEVPQIAVGSLCMAIENMAAAASWGQGNPLAATIQIGDSSWQTRTESFTRSDGTAVSRKLRGVWKTATVLRVDTHYEITFDNYNLGAHPQASAADPVSWHKGIVRVPVAGRPADDRRALTVLQVSDSGGKLLLAVADDSGEPDLIVEGAGVLMNYYPGYRLYLHADPAHGFTSAAVMPIAGEGSRATILAARAVDHATLDDNGQPYRSPVGVPQLLSAVEIVAPAVPDKPKGLKYATPPDAYDKCTYTLTVRFKHTPFAAAFYRADALSILRALYLPATVQAIRDKIFPPESDPFFANRWDHLLAFSYVAGAMEFQAFPLGSGNYALPHPDADAFDGDKLTPLDALGDKIKSAVMEVFLPLTEQPLIYSLVRDDSNYVPTNKKQTFRNPNGDVLAPGDPGFDLAPMARRYDDNGIPTIQFVDFTLDGSMNRNTVYFYFAREIGNRMKIGEASPTFGPVELVNLSPPSAPVLRKLVTVPYDMSTMRNPQVSFEVVVPSKTDPVSKISIYRASSALDALTLRTMTKVQEIDLTTLVPTADGTLVVADDFSSDTTIPYGEPLFYRVAWIRDVAYEDVGGAAKIASAISEPTKTLLANLIDVVNPTAPVPTLQLLSTTLAGDKFLRMSWGKTVHNGTYYASRLAPSGNWVRVGTVKTNNALVALDLPDALPVNDDEGNKIYYRFKTDVENSSGLLNLVAAPVTVSLDTII